MLRNLNNRGAAQPAASEGLHSFSPPFLPALSGMMLIILAADLSLTDILTPAHLLPLFNDHPDLVPALFPHLPPDLPFPPSEQVLQRIIQ